MDARPRSLVCLAALLLFGPAASIRGQSEPPPVGRLLPVAVHDDCADCVLPALAPGDKLILIVGSLARDAGLHRVRLTTEAGAGTTSLPLDESSPDPAWQEHVREVQQRLATRRQEPARHHEYSPSPDPPRQKLFHVFAGGNDFLSPESYVRVTATLKGLGGHGQVYVDREVPDAAALQPTVDDLVATFDHEVYPRARQLLGRALDVDRDGRFTILLTPRLGRMAGGKVSLGGFVRGSDFFRNLQAPFGNRCDMMYLNSDLKPGPYLHTLLAHEYTHAIVFSEHVFASYVPGLPRQDEEGWLNEGLAHLVEDVHGYSWANLDYRISAFLNAPERYQLVVPDYYRAGLFRSHGNRGATYLFLRWCADRCGADFLTRLTRTNLSGVANLEVTTGEPFARLFREWTAAVAFGGTDLPLSEVPPLSHPHLRGPVGGRLLCGPRFEDVPLSPGRRELTLAGTAAVYLLLHSSPGTPTHLTVRAEPGTQLQVSLIRLPPQTPRLVACCEPERTPGSYRLRVIARDADVTLNTAVWERRVPQTNRPGDTSFSAPNGTTAIAWAGGRQLKPGHSCRSLPFTLPEPARPDSEWVIKVQAADAAGHVLAAWTTIPPTPGSP